MAWHGDQQHVAQRPKGRVSGRVRRDPWDDPEPIRSELFGPERFDQHAVTLADSHTVVHRSVPVVSLLRRLQSNVDALAAAHARIIADIDADRPITPAAEWLADNFHAVEKHTRQVKVDLPLGYFRELPKLGAGFLEGHPRIFAIIWAFVAHTDSKFDPDLLARYVRAYENRQSLTTGEVWAVSITLRLILLENLRRIADMVIASSADRRHGDEVADRLLGLYEGRAPEELDQIVPKDFVASRAFAVQLVRRLRGTQATAPMEWLATQLAAQHTTRDQAIHDEHQSQARFTVTVNNIFTSLSLIQDMNWEDWFEEVSLIEEELRTTAGYVANDFATRNLYRSAIEGLARGARQSELGVTRAALHRARFGATPLQQDVGYWLIGDGRREFARAIDFRPTVRQRAGQTARAIGIAGYVLALTLATLACLALLLWLVNWAAGGLQRWVLVVLAVLGLLPVSDFALGVVNNWSTRLFGAKRLPSLDLKDGIPEADRTLVAVPEMLTSPGAVDEMIAGLEVHYLANRDGAVHFALLTDWADAEAETVDNDEALLTRARAGVQALNARYGPHFLLLHRRRQFNPREGKWMGWERKRGKLDELNLLLRGSTTTSFIVIEGNLPDNFRYVVTLDADTLLPRECARSLVGKMAHPLNRARFDARREKVIGGYGILQPRVTPSLPTIQGSSLYQRTFSTRRGLDPYALAVSDVYQDLFEEGSFAGKGIYDIDAVTTVFEGKIPENTLLSHDLLEGNYARSGLVTDVEVVEEYPTSYAVDAKRHHRWVRGDWQLLPWMTVRRTGISALGQWKMLDNLRRSLSPISWVLALLAGLILLPLGGAVAWVPALIGSFFLPPLLPLLGRLRPVEGITLRSQVGAFMHELRQALLVGLMNLTLLPHKAWLMLDAIWRTLWRLTISRKHLLEWTTAAASKSNAQGDLRSYARLMRGGFLTPAVALAVSIWQGWPFLVLLAAPLVLWLSAPAIMQWASQVHVPAQIEATREDRRELRPIGRRTWHFFETFVTPDDHHLPPDNFQEQPEPVVARRTSPTNIGLYLLSTISARDLGWIGLSEAVDRLEATLTTLAGLEHYRGHIYNWYDTSSAEPLHPRYVSTVDSGNLAGHLLAVASACREWVDTPDLHTSPARGVLDTVVLVRQALAQVRLETDVHQTESIVEALARIEQLCKARLDDPVGPWIDELTDPVEEILGESLRLGDAGSVTTSAPAGVSETVDWAKALQRTVSSLHRDRILSEPRRARLNQRLAQLERVAYREAVDMDFKFLYNTRRNLFAIGYHVGEAKMDDNCYDMLASEARLSSLVAIAKGDAGTRHWRGLGRSVTPVDSSAALMSWSGSMFEYLMPPLVLRAPDQSLLTISNEMAVRKQMQYAESMGVPWGISESAYNARDLNHTYQYSPFGCPGLGVVRGLADNLVIAPYATGLATMFFPSAAVRNYQRLREYDACGRFGFYEALDFTSSRVPEGHSHAVVRSYMAHHQGMTVVAINNTVSDGLMRDRFHAEPMIKAAELLLQEPAPTLVPVTIATKEEQRTTGRTVHRAAPPTERTFHDREALQPGLHLLSNGRMSLRLTPGGAGQVLWNDVAITRWHPDPTTESGGDFIFLRDDQSERVWSATAAPIPGRPGYDVNFAEHRAEYVRRRTGIVTHLECVISPEADAVVRRVTIRNTKRRRRRLTLTSYAELVLGRPGDDDAHPAFSKMFVHTEFVPELDAIIATRRPRTGNDRPVWAGHLLVVESDTNQGVTRAETDRYQFIGRGRSLANPRQLTGIKPTGSTGYVLDPIFSLSKSLRIPGESEAVVSIWTFAASTREEVLTLIDRHRSKHAYQRTAMMAWTEAQIQLRHLGIDSDDATLYQTLAGHLVYGLPSLRPPAEVLAADGREQSALWPMGISGDLPILLVRINDPDQIQLVREAIRAFEYYRLKRFPVDLVIMNDQSSDYLQHLQRNLENMARAVPPLDGGGMSGSIHVVSTAQVPPESALALPVAARVVLTTGAGTLAEQLRREGVADREFIAPVTPPVREEVPLPALDITGLRYFNGYGGFNFDGTEYVTVIDNGETTPAPWINVVANADFGFHASAEGAGYTWWRNSRDNQITPWRNDPVCTPISEAFYVRDADSGELSSPCAAPIAGGRHIAYHGFGYTRYQHRAGDLDQLLTQFVPTDDPVKLSVLEITNSSAERRTISVTAYAEFVLGMNRHQHGHRLVTELDPVTGALLVRNPWSTQYPDQVIGFDLLGEQTSWTGDRKEFLGQQGSYAAPAAVASGRQLSNNVGAGLDPCGALQRSIELAPGETMTVTALLVAGVDHEAVRGLITKYRRLPAEQVLDGVRAYWRDNLATIQVRTPERTFDLMMNGWLLYQSLSCRMLARSGYYQASGAYGFRDQLQDSMALELIDADFGRAQILRAASRQFKEGDVQHWWLPASGMGIRTKISDDVVWLSYAVARYVELTGDVAILDEPVTWLEGDPLPENEAEAFFQPTTSTDTAPLYDHCVRALERAFRTGRHGMPLMGTGDWNDGMNRVGAGGEGESVWLGWFTHATLSEFLPLAAARGDHAFVERATEFQHRLLEALDTDGWDGRWYRRGYFDDGTPLGSHTRPECRIDAIAQSWAVMSKAADPDHVASAMEEVTNQLIGADRVARLFTPPFDTSEPDPGYIRSYPPGVRENGGQYTHGSQWSIFAFAELGRHDRAAWLFSMINPITHALTKDEADRYRVEPYVVAADVYSVPPYDGRGGWTWYTGSSGWLYRAGLEAILGVRREGAWLRLDPCLPPEWTEANVVYRVGDACCEIQLIATSGAGPRTVTRIEYDGRPLEGTERVPLESGAHLARVWLGPRDDTQGSPEGRADGSQLATR